MLAQGTNNGVHTARFHTTSGNAQTCLYGTTRTSALYASSFVIYDTFLYIIYI